eukprot:TRINITY_DN9054_c0_g1_i13.p1 TRINITY_DN9054_c0_g1~~TRINITY_DN9054_c0_g1_i13.p1  ORF type:complete len:194 (+),score=37.38 TRINITY_DN9054_c0_g1_i13:47-628(+)
MDARRSFAECTNNHNKKMKTIKLMIIGSADVGKTSILVKYTQDTFVESYNATLSFDFVSVTRTVNERPLCLHLWDTVGQERYRSLGALYLRGADACILVFDLTKRDTFAALDGWVSFLMSQLPEYKVDNFPLILLGNKADLEDRRVTTEEAKVWCSQHRQIPYFEVSAKTGQGINASFESIAKKADEVISADE